MLRIINKYSHGFSLVPVVLALREKGFFELIGRSAPLSLDDLAREMGVVDGYLATCLDMLQVIQWVDRQDDVFVPGPLMDQQAAVPAGMDALYAHGPEVLVQAPTVQPLFRQWLEAVVEGWGQEDPLEIMIDGVVLLPALCR